ncbi:hypothetical protein AURDEDRAFT_165953 [Auricularia subglabra TFB-10046 SS5]|nr:hypothetical protein AURDEDRAFT_165953 [Auricularia subglabra TFB-10046 SS5]
MRVCRPGTAYDNVWHVLDVLDGSPAECAGLVPFGDWIVGQSGSSLCVESDLTCHYVPRGFDPLREVVLVSNQQ